jgi:hypothetical protein
MPAAIVGSVSGSGLRPSCRKDPPAFNEDAKSKPEDNAHPGTILSRTWERSVSLLRILATKWCKALRARLRSGRPYGTLRLTVSKCPNCRATKWRQDSAQGETRVKPRVIICYDKSPERAIVGVRRHNDCFCRIEISLQIQPRCQTLTIFRPFPPSQGLCRTRQEGSFPRVSPWAEP